MIPTELFYFVAFLALINASQAMAKNKFYIFNSQTLTYDPVRSSRRRRWWGFLRHLSSGILLGAAFFVVIYFFFGSPKEKMLEYENQQLKSQYKLLSRRVDEVLVVLDDIRQRDDNLYRVILQAEPVGDDVRNAGIDNASRYAELLHMPDGELIASVTRKVDRLSRNIYVQNNSFDQLVGLAHQQENRIKHLPAIQPVSNKDLKKTASGYGWRIDPIYNTRRFHEGMDFSAAVGTPVYATGNATVKEVGWQQGYGNTIVLDHGFGYVTRYAHLSKISVAKGQKVVRGENIGEVGNTGKSTGPHLHYEVIYKGQVQNPVNYYFMDLTPEEYDRMIQLAGNQGRVMD